MWYSLTVHSTIIAFLSVIGHLKKRSITFETDIWFHCSIELFVWNSLILSSIWLGSRCLSFHVLLKLFGATPCFKTPPDIYQMQIDTGMKPFRNLRLSFQAASSRALLILQNFKIEYSFQPFYCVIHSQSYQYRCAAIRCGPVIIYGFRYSLDNLFQYLHPYVYKFFKLRR